MSVPCVVSLVSRVPYPLSRVWCLVSRVPCVASRVSYVSCLLSPISCLPSPVLCLLPRVSYLVCLNLQKPLNPKECPGAPENTSRHNLEPPPMSSKHSPSCPILSCHLPKLLLPLAPWPMPQVPCSVSALCLIYRMSYISRLLSHALPLPSRVVRLLSRVSGVACLLSNAPYLVSSFPCLVSRVSCLVYLSCLVVSSASCLVSRVFDAHKNAQ